MKKEKKITKTSCKKKGMNIYILLDRSGSMSSMWAEAISSINEYVSAIKKDKAKDKITLAVFDSDGCGGLDFNVIRERVPINEWENVSACEVTPRNCTPLYDAFARIVSMAECDNKEKTAIVVVTDGAENASHEYTICQVRDMIKRLECKSWQLTFLGANFDACGYTSTAFGVSKDYVLNASTGNFSSAMHSTATLHSNYRSMGKGTACYTQDDRIAAKEDEVKTYVTNNTISIPCENSSSCNCGNLSVTNNWVFIKDDDTE